MEEHHSTVTARSNVSNLSGEPSNKALGRPASPASAVLIQRLHEVSTAQCEQLADVLLDCVQGGASVGFMLPLARSRALDFWRGVATGVAQQQRVLLVAHDAHGIAGTVQLVLDQPDNQPHRADLVKMLVHRRLRCRGVGGRLMAAAEAEARACGKTLLVLDTASAEASRIYLRQGWEPCGVIPGYALMPDGTPCATTYFYRALTP